MCHFNPDFTTKARRACLLNSVQTCENKRLRNNHTYITSAADVTDHFIFQLVTLAWRWVSHEFRISFFKMFLNYANIDNLHNGYLAVRRCSLYDCPPPPSNLYPYPMQGHNLAIIVAIFLQAAVSCHRKPPWVMVVCLFGKLDVSGRVSAPTENGYKGHTAVVWSLLPSFWRRCAAALQIDPREFSGVGRQFQIGRK